MYYVAHCPWAHEWIQAKFNIYIYDEKDTMPNSPIDLVYNDNYPIHSDMMCATNSFYAVIMNQAEIQLKSTVFLLLQL